MKTIKIDEQTHQSLLAAKYLYHCKNLSEIIQKALDSLEVDLLIAKVKPDEHK